MDRRDFLKALGLASTAALSTSCLEGYHWMGTKSSKLIPYLVPPDDGIIPGESYFYPGTCSECPAHCPLLVKVQYGMAAKQQQPNPHQNAVVKLEGNPEHPVSGGGLCMRGQASLTRRYHPERLKQPLCRNQSGELAPISLGRGVPTHCPGIGWRPTTAKFLSVQPYHRLAVPAHRSVL